MMKAISEEATAGAASGEADSAVRNNPYTVNGWRPVSVVIQPASTAMKPEGAIATANMCSSRESYSLPLHAHQQAEQAERQHQQSHADHDPERPERDRHRRPVFARHGVEAGHRRVQANA